VAEKVLQNSSLTNRAAILAVIGSNNPAGLRRLQGKFDREGMVAAAKARAEAAEQARQTAAQQKLEAMRRALDFFIGGPCFQETIRNIAATPFMQNIERMRREGVFERAWRKVQQSPFMQTLDALQKTGVFSSQIKIPGWPGLPSPSERRD
jgi:hypothetical protein